MEIEKIAGYELIDTGLLSVYKNNDNYYVNGKELCKVLQVKSRYNDWMRIRIRQFSLIEKDDFNIHSTITNGRPSIIRMLKINIANALCIASHSKIGNSASIFLSKYLPNVVLHNIPDRIYNNFAVIETGLVPIYETPKDDYQYIAAKDLYDFLEIKSKFSDWINNRISQFKLFEGKDYYRESKNLDSIVKVDYMIKIDSAKLIAMKERNSQGDIIRNYFLEIEKQHKKSQIQNIQTNDMIDSKLMYKIAKTLEEKENEILELTPKAESYDKFISGKNSQDMNTAAKVLGWGRNLLFKELRNKSILRQNNTPYQKYIDAGYFEVKETIMHLYDSTSTINKPQTYCTPKGLDWLSKILKKEDLKNELQTVKH